MTATLRRSPEVQRTGDPEPATETTSEHATHTARDAVVRSWRERTRRRRGTVPEGWDDPVTIRLAQAAADRADVGSASRAFGTARYRAGWTHAETLDDVEDLAGAWPSVPPDQLMAMMRSVAAGWVDAMTAETVSLPHRDLLTGLPTTGYLVVATELLYRRPGADPARTHRFVVAQLPPHRGGTHRVGALLRLGDHARTAFDDECTVATLGSLGIIVLADAAAADLAMRSVAPGAGPLTGLVVRSEPLPGHAEHVEPRIAHLAGHRLTPTS
jgi:hypothetical protein